MSKCTVGGGIDLMRGKQKDWETDLSKVTQTGEKLQLWYPFNMLLLTWQMLSQSE